MTNRCERDWCFLIFHRIGNTSAATAIWPSSTPQLNENKGQRDPFSARAQARLAQCRRKPAPVNESEGKGQHPSAVEFSLRQVLDSHIDDRDRESVAR